MNRKKWRWVILLPVLAAGVVWWAIPDYGGDLENFRAVVKIRDCNGQPLRTTLGDGDIFCDPVPLDQTGDWTVKALIAAEDKRFFRHGGIDSIAVGRAVLYNVARGRVVSGASTLTTLVVKMTEPRRRSLWTKVIEAHHARELEATLSKEEILEQFINRAPFGGNLYGVEAASQRYFGKPAKNLNLAESALLMGLPQSPSRLQPDRHPQRTLRRRTAVLWRMRKNGTISTAQYETARNQPIALKKTPQPFRAPHFCDLILQRYPEQTTLETTLDLELQQVAERVLQTRINELARFGICGGAVVVIDVRTGELRAMVGSPDFWASQVNGATACRSPGSTLKPFAYATAIEQGIYTPATLLADVPTSFAGYRPKNYTLEYSGPATVRRALVQSLNIPALRCVQQIGLDGFVRRLRDLGFSTLDRPAEYYGLGVVIGSCETTLLDLSNAYACLARKGIYSPLHFLQNEPALEPTRIYSEATAFMMANMLGGEERTLELVGHRADVFLPQIAWKTGTSSGHRDAWAIAYNPEYVVGVWLGNPDGSSSPRLVGGSAAAPVVGEIFRRLYPDNRSPWYEKPAGLKLRTICAHSGFVPGAHCTATTTDYCIPRISPTQKCTLCNSDNETWPPEIQAFLEARGMSETVATEKNLSIESPASDETFRLLPVTPGLRQEIKLAAISSEPLYWFIDGKLHESNFWPLEKGAHTIACVDSSGRTAQVKTLVE